MSAGHAVDEIIHADNGDIQVSPGGMDEMIAAYAEYIAISGEDHYFHVGLGQVQTGGKRNGPSVSGVEGIHFQITGHSAGAADAGDHCHLV